jgi:glycosyltransferase involved in cell wall biosynthesis
MRILHVSTYDQGGGAEAVACQLLDEHRRLGHDSFMLVGEKRTSHHHIQCLEHQQFSGVWDRSWQGVADRLLPFEGRLRGVWRFRRWLQTVVADPQRWIDLCRGRENFRFPGTWHLLNGAFDRPDILHCHNLHGGWLSAGGYFDLRALPWLASQVPTVLTLHDTWLLSGHCAYTLGCERWKDGCGSCPDLSIYPPVRRDSTEFNWQRKRDIFARSRLHLVTPSQWLMDQVKQSMLAPGMVQSRVIPNGVDLSVFHPGDKSEARHHLGLPQDASILLYAANAAKSNRFKDYPTVEAAATKVGAASHGQRVIMIVLGEGGTVFPIPNGEIRYIPFVKDRRTTARFYQAADLYVHAARSDTFPNTVLEALASGVPVVATAVDGIPEQIDEGRTGFLVPKGDAEGLASKVVQLISQPRRLRAMGESAAQTAAAKFSLETQANAYLHFYEQMRQSHAEVAA